MTRHLRLLAWFADDPARTTPRPRPSWWRADGAGDVMPTASSGVGATAPSQTGMILERTSLRDVFTRRSISDDPRRPSKRVSVPPGSRTEPDHGAQALDDGSCPDQGMRGVGGIADFENDTLETVG